MKYLQPSNESTDEYYWEIDASEYKEKEKSSFSVSKNTHGGRLISFLDRKIEAFIEYDNYYILGGRGQILELPDEWFLVEVYTSDSKSNISGLKFYLCDQLNGLIKLIKDIVDGSYPNINLSINKNTGLMVLYFYL